MSTNTTNVPVTFVVLVDLTMSIIDSSLSKEFKHFKYAVMEKEKLYALQGIIFQKGFSFAIGEKPGIGTAAKIEQTFNYGMFHAVIGPSSENPEILCGHMSDRWGNSIITDFMISEKELSFAKRYTNRPAIHYIFGNKEDGTWKGIYEGPDCGRGTCKCVVIEINESFFDPMS